MGLLKMLLTGEDDDFSLDQLAANEAAWQDQSSNDIADEMAFVEAQQFLESRPGMESYSPERATQQALQREARESRQRDELVSRVGNLFMVVESMLRLLKAKGILDEADLRRMEQQVDQEDGQQDGEFHPGQPPTPSHCPKCDARIAPSKTMCMFCGHRCSPERLEVI